MKTVDKALRILETISDSSEPVSVTELVQHLQTNKTTVSRILAVLREHGLIRQVAARKYQLDLGIVRLASPLEHRSELIAKAIPHIGRLLHEVGNGIYLGVLWRRQHVTLYQICDSDRPLASADREFLSPVHTSSICKIILAHRTPESVETLMADYIFFPRTNMTIHNLTDYLSELERCRQLGYAVNNEENHLGIRSIAGPILDKQGTVVAGLAVGGLISEAKMMSIAPVLLDYCRMISFNLGYSVSAPTSEVVSHKRTGRKAFAR